MEKSSSQNFNIRKRVGSVGINDGAAKDILQLRNALSEQKQEIVNMCYVKEKLINSAS